MLTLILFIISTLKVKFEQTGGQASIAPIPELVIVNLWRMDYMKNKRLCQKLFDQFFSQINLGRLKPMDIFILTKPCKLTFCISPGVTF
ncbi:hypothetical protein SAMN04487931_103169 [Desulfobacula phenolica]|uniref:Uncharacterized protein n=1 Tax=Desulfobacula phenolica TaxID=90732 RepID=A0A1H2EJN6_9BACT|nr:hypothetical protein SAMN04487931_103169 [Desulfobacula phenolica]